MDRDTTTSFIPKGALNRLDERPRPKPFGLFTTLSVLLLIISGAFFGGSYFYRQVLDQAINRPCQAVAGADGQSGFSQCGLRASVVLEEKNLDRGTIVLLQRLDHKLKLADNLLTAHNTALPVFKLLEDLTLANLRYNQFSFGVGLPAGQAGKSLNLSGTAGSYEDIAVQSQIFGKDRARIQSFIFSDLDLNAQGQVNFKLVVTIDPTLLSYLKNLNS